MFNKAQTEAICHDQGPCMVLAGPGSGKTTVITERVRHLIQHCGVSPEEILVITFTNAAAAEMKARFLKLTENAYTGVTFGTFHAVFYYFLRTDGRQPVGGVLPEREKMMILSDILRKESAGGSPERDIVSNLLSEISYVKNNHMNPATFRSKTPGVDFCRIFTKFELAKQREGRLDFDDMLTLTYDLFSKDETALNFWRERFHYILIDEFQDVNRLQYEIVKMLAAPRNNLFIVGDDDQSIYKFRGARPEIMLDFPKEFRKAKTIVLDVNYRSVSEIVERSLKVIGHNKARYKKKLRAETPGKQAVITESFPDEKAEYERVTEEIEAYRKAGKPLHQIAILVRTNQGAGAVLEKLEEHGIPFFTKERVPNIYEHFLAGPVFAYLNWVLGDRSRGNFLKMMNAPARYIRRTDIADEVVDLKALGTMYRTETDRGWMAEKISFLAYQLELLAKLKTPFAMVNYLRRGMGYEEYALQLAADRHVSEKDAVRILDEIQESAKNFMTVDGWYRHIVKHTRELQERMKDRETREDGKVMVSTLHAAKGLEYEVVYIVDVNEKNIPHEKSVTPEEIEEERRMFYVGMTRAAKKLCLFSTRERYGKKTEPSRFLRELK